MRPPRTGESGAIPMSRPSFHHRWLMACSSPAGACPALYPTVLWEMTDDCTINGTTCVSNMGETWSRPVVGRIKVINDSGATEDRYVAIFGGGFDPTFKPGDTILGMNLAHGGHLTHGHPLSFSGREYNVVAYGVRREDERIDYDELAALAADVNQLADALETTERRRGPYHAMATVTVGDQQPARLTVELPERRPL